MTFAEAAGIMIGGNGGLSELPKPDIITYQDDDTYNGTITETYNSGTDNEYLKRIRVSFSNKGTVNEQVNSLYFYKEDGSSDGSVSFSGFYVG